MKIIRNPKKETWRAHLARPAFDTKYLRQTVASILEEVKTSGDTAIKHFAKEFDKVDLEDFLVTEQEFADADRQITEELKAAIKQAAANIEKFHAAQAEKPRIIE